MKKKRLYDVRDRIIKERKNIQVKISMRYKIIIFLLVVLIFGLLVMSGVPIEKCFLWMSYVSLAFLVSNVLWQLFAFIWILILQKKSYDRFLFWIKPKSKRRLKKKRKKKKGK
ncbi:hypothetical protein [Neobacillus drentensis]|uniref:hypothetical protein n=1 Tax=Neobacillus drentensis TaxID=220684 RepID=UPI0030011A3E